MLSPRHYLHDLIYNPAETVFLEKGRQAGAAVKNGYEMLVLQAEKSRELFGL
jgi:shikimate dehydrogenase